MSRLDEKNKEWLSDIGIKFGQSQIKAATKVNEKILRDMKSFSSTNLKYMQYFHELYGDPQVGDLMNNFELSPQAEDFEKIIFKIPHGYNMVEENYQLKGETDTPTLGLLICKYKDNVKAQYALEASNQPMGISEYDINQFMPENFKSSLLTIEEIENELREVTGSE